ncbi:MAG: hypothetical protein EBU90_16105 [Proteobacteria bacterium]|nr:hypothetical protein [Pseudomonadota bacterium]NBP15145.1 hypothetical protein [bacterium]
MKKSLFLSLFILSLFSLAKSFETATMKPAQIDEILFDDYFDSVEPETIFPDTAETLPLGEDALDLNSNGLDDVDFDVLLEYQDPFAPDSTCATMPNLPLSLQDLSIPPANNHHTVSAASPASKGYGAITMEENEQEAQPAAQDQVIINREPQQGVDFSRQENGSYKCKQCPFKGENPSRVIEHIKVLHFNQEIHKCAQCTRAFSTNGHLKEHINTEHDLLRKFRCPYSQCDYTCNHKGDLNKHARARSGKYKKYHTTTPDWSIIYSNTADDQN